MLACATLLTALFAATPVRAPATTASPEEDWAVVTEAVERIPFPPSARHAQLRVDPLLSTIEITSVSPLAVDPSGKVHSALCPRVERISHGLRLKCATTHLDASWASNGESLALEVRQLRGLPWGPHSGAFETADRFPRGSEERLRASLNTGQKHAAALSLGELALSRSAFAEAVKWLRLTAGSGTPDRIAQVHLCELGIQCGDPAHLFDDGLLAEPQRTEMNLRQARFFAFEGQLTKAIESLQRRFADDTRPVLDDAQRAACAPIVLAALSSADLELNQAALAFYISLDVKPGTPDSVRLVNAAADASARLGAPVFGAHLLSAVTPAVAPEDLSVHLAHAQSLYLQGDDRVRAEMIFRFAKSKFRRADPVQKRTHDLSTTELNQQTQSPDMDVTSEMARAVLARSRATAFQRESR